MRTLFHTTSTGETGLHGLPSGWVRKKGSGWRKSGASVLLEAFLLATDSYETVATELGLPVKEVALYGRLFFDVRDDQGKTRLGVLMRLKAELQTQEDDPANRLRRIALTGGIHGLRRVLYGSVQAAEPDLDQLVETELTRRLHAGELRTGDLVRLQANAIARERITVDNKDKNGKIKGTESMEAVLHILSLTAPIMVQADHSSKREVATNESLKGRLDAQRTTSPTSLTDEPDKGYQKLTELMAAQFKKPEY